MIKKENQNIKPKAGFISLVGKPNAGKSSLLNALVGEKVSIVTPKSQTTRDRVLGILSSDDYQMIFIDTPGIHEDKTELSKFMNRAVTTATKDADVVVIVIDSTKPINSNIINMIEGFLIKSDTVYIALNKVDLTKFEKLYPILEKLTPLTIKTENRFAVKEIVPISCRTKKNIDKLKELILAELPEGEFYYPKDELTDRPIRFLCEEIIREKALLFLQDEIPHGVGVMVQTMQDDDKGTLAKIQADIVCERETHKQIIIGRKGEMLKQIGQSARLEMEKLLEKKVYLELFVKVRENWRNRRNIMDDLGYGKN